MTGFEKYLLENGFISITPYKEFSSYDTVARSYKKEDNTISIGLMDNPTRIGIRYPAPYKVLAKDENGDIIVVREITNKYTYLPSPDQYKEWEQVLTDL
jgi:hypothetical protein